MELRLFNTLTGRKETFAPQKPPEVLMYNCGPTVYDYIHIGNLRAFVFADILRRTLEWSGFSVRQVMNITDVGHLTSDADEGEDKLEKGAQREHKSAQEIAKFYTQAFFDDITSLNCKGDGTQYPRATQYIAEQIALVEKLEAGGYTYKTSDGIYFDTSRFPTYGKLGNIDLAGLKEGVRVAVGEKKHSTDFAVWKFSPEHTEREQEWNSPWGRGFPGWHLECSAMSMKLLGETLDIHTGGIDHIPVHHNNEIAQSEAATGKLFARFWLHNAFINISGDKMAKSAGTFIRLTDLKSQGVSPLGYRFFLLESHYRSPVNFTFEAAQAAEQGLHNLYRQLSELPEGGAVHQSSLDTFTEKINDDLNTPQALAVISEILASDIAPADKLATILECDRVLGLALSDGRARFGALPASDIPTPVRNLLAEREQARARGNFDRADLLRQEIKQLGFAVEDSPEGAKVRKIGLP